jgi:hypothetical protein
MADRSRKRPRRLSAKDREFENLLREVFFAFKGRKRPKHSKSSASRRNEKA